MSPCMTAIQMSVLDIMKACIAELKRYNPCVSEFDPLISSLLNTVEPLLPAIIYLFVPIFLNGEVSTLQRFNLYIGRFFVLYFELMLIH